MRTRMLLGCVGMVTLGCTSTTLPAGEGGRAPEGGRPGPVAAGGETLVLAEGAEPEGPAPVADEPAAPAGAWLGAGTRRGLAAPGAREEEVAVWVDVPHVAAREVPRATAVVVDTSGSMQGAKIVQARRAAAALIEGHRLGDRLSLVSFDSTVRQLLPPADLDGRSRADLLAAVSQLRADGDTHLEGGLRLGFWHLSQAPATHPVRRLILISDGRATVGQTSSGVLAAMAESEIDRGTQVTAVGVGLDYDEVTLNGLATRSGGRLHHIERPEMLGELVRRELALLDATAATMASLELSPAHGVALVSVKGVRSVPTHSGGLRIPLGALHAGQRRELAVKVRLPEGGDGTTRTLLSARLTFGDPAADGVQRVQEALVAVTFTSDESRIAASHDPRASEILSRLAAADNVALAAARANDGDFSGADQELARAEAVFRQQASQARDARERRNLEAQAERVARSRSSVRAAAASPPSARAGRASALDLNEAAMKMNGY